MVMAADERVRFPDISPTAWEHPTDRAALNALRRIPGFDVVLRKLVGMFGEKAVRLTFKANAVKVGPNQYPWVHERVLRVCDTFDLAEVPEVYVSQTPLVNAGAVGFDTPFIVLNSSTLEILDRDQVEAVIGHEVAHIMSGHAVYRTEDPRCTLLRDVARRLGGPLADLAERVEQRVVDVLAELKPGRKLYANVEFYAGVVMHHCGIPPECLPVVPHMQRLFVLALSIF